MSQKLYRFNNNYGASVVDHGYGSDQGLLELAVIMYDEKGGYELVYDTHITDDVIGYLKQSEVDKILKDIEKL